MMLENGRENAKTKAVQKKRNSRKENPKYFAKVFKLGENWGNFRQKWGVVKKVKC